jgi:hypothetical protein
MLFNWRLVKKAGRYGLIAIGTIVATAFLCIAALLSLPYEIHFRSDFLEAKYYIAQLEEYKQKNGRYPGEEDQDIVPQSGHIFYNGGGSRYTLDLALSFDVDYCYYSDTREWLFKMCPASK